MIHLESSVNKERYLIFLSFLLKGHYHYKLKENRGKYSYGYYTAITSKCIIIEKLKHTKSVKY